MPASSCPIESFPALDRISGIRAAFVGRVPGVEVNVDRELALERLAPFHEEARRMAGFAGMEFATARQVHGCEVAEVGYRDGSSLADCDGLLTTRRNVCLGIYVADCAPVYICDRSARGIALVHSGRKGTELGIVPHAIARLCETTGALPSDLVLQIGPCIRPPFYEIDFASDIRRQAQAAGVIDVFDCKKCTASDLAAYYSYRMELGRTGRLLALLAML